MTSARREIVSLSFTLAETIDSRLFPVGPAVPAVVAVRLAAFARASEGSSIHTRMDTPNFRYGEEMRLLSVNKNIRPT